MEGKTMQLYLGDFLEIMRSLPDASVDAVVTDPPYGIGKAGWDGWFPRDWFYEARRVVKPHGRFVVLTNPGEALQHTLALLGPIYQTTFAAWLCNGMTRGPVSFGNWIAVSVGGTDRKWRPIQDVIRATIRPSEKVEGHPSPKPLGLMCDVITRTTEPGWIVLDPFMGSGTTGVACVQEGRDFIGIERERAYYEIAERRIGEEK
jgi:site-specific DNA-methyltransferase (adenine-specific)